MAPTIRYMNRENFTSIMQDPVSFPGMLLRYY